ncbi:MAG: DUF928 domain-containing protein [Leptolyngbya sp. SIO3F4]|nr:DUF928 domain-containing protein [Leptolyngbya sp. SIO3F4]
MFETVLLPVVSMLLASTELITPIVYKDVFEPPGDTRPDNTRAGGSRTDLACNANEPSIQALLPVNQYALTLQARPEIFVQLAGTSARSAVLIFEDPQADYYERVVVTIPEGESFVNWSLPNSAAPLVVGKNYRWSVSLICDQFSRPNDPVLSGWVQRTEADNLPMDLDEESLAQAFAAEGYWYDLLSWFHQQGDNQLQAFWQQYQQRGAE